MSLWGITVLLSLLLCVFEKFHNIKGLETLTWLYIIFFSKKENIHYEVVESNVILRQKCKCDKVGNSGFKRWRWCVWAKSASCNAVQMQGTWTALCRSRFKQNRVRGSSSFGKQFGVSSKCYRHRCHMTQQSQSYILTGNMSPQKLVIFISPLFIKAPEWEQP